MVADTLRQVKVDQAPEVFGETIKDARKSLGWSQAELARQFGHALGRKVNPLVVTRIEGGKRPVSITELTALASVFKTTPGMLLEGLTLDTDHIEAGRAVGQWLMQEAAVRKSFCDLSLYLRRHPHTRETIYTSLLRDVGAEAEVIMRRLDEAVTGESGALRPADVRQVG